ncbi:MAG TPA: LuxR C-terminal-related transcriptional regulator, partial [Baekduia sp.]|nr:LuxR C-terminal-related transcriptional regulator [Baekduia sp.]
FEVGRDHLPAEEGGGPARPRIGPDPQVVQLAGLALDRAADRHRREDDRRRLVRVARERDVMAAGVTDGVVVLDAAGRCTAVNPAAAELLGRPAEQLRGRSFHATVHHSRPDGTPLAAGASPIQLALRDGEVHRVRGDVLWTGDDRPVTVDYTSSPIRDGDEVTGAVVVLRRCARSGSRPAGEHLLSVREREILAGLAEGRTGPELARQLHISPTTLQTHLRNAIAKLGATGRTHAVVLALARGEITTP